MPPPRVLSRIQQRWVDALHRHVGFLRPQGARLPYSTYHRTSSLSLLTTPVQRSIFQRRCFSLSTSPPPLRSHPSSLHDETSSSSSSSSSLDDPPSPPPSSPPLFSGELFWSIVLVVQFTSFMYCFRHYCIDILSCVGPSMLPTMNSSGDLVLISRLSRQFQRGDVVVATSPTNPSTKLCKRIIALAGDEQPGGTGERIPSGHLWLQGDNMGNSSDSRHYGAVPEGLVMGRVVWKVWPVREWGRVERTMKYSGLEGTGEERREEREREEEEEGFGRRLPGRGGVQVLAESGEVNVERASEATPMRRSVIQPQIAIIPFTPATKRDAESHR